MELHYIVMMCQLMTHVTDTLTHNSIVDGDTTTNINFYVYTVIMYCKMVVNA